MSKDWVQDITDMHLKFGVNEKVKEFSPEKLKIFLKFRISCFEEEIQELKDAQSGDEAVDALIDLCVFVIGTLDSYGIDSHTAWDRVYEANMQKSPGIKKERPNKFGLPDLIKPENWIAPTHIDNIGLFKEIF